MFATRPTAARPAATAPRPSLLMWGAGPRLVAAAAVLLALWLSVAWALAA